MSIVDQYRIFDNDFNRMLAAIRHKEMVFSGLTVSERGAGANMSVDVATGEAWVNNSLVSKGSVTNVAIAASDPSLPRKSIIVMDSAGVITEVAGTPQAADPSGNVGPYTKAPVPPDIPVNKVILGEVWVATAVTAIYNADITDRRVFFDVQNIPIKNKTLKQNLACDAGVTIDGIDISSLLGGGYLKPITLTVVYFLDLAVTSSPRTATVSSVSGDIITLTAAGAALFWGQQMNNNVYLYIQNTTRSEFAWVKASPNVNQLQVTNAADIAAWVNGNIVSTQYLAAPYNNLIKLDVTPLVGSGRSAVFVRVGATDTAGAGAEHAVRKSWDLQEDIVCVTSAANRNDYRNGFVGLDQSKYIVVRDTSSSGGATLRPDVRVNAVLIPF